MRKSTSGFTIVELLIVIVVIGILAAIVVVAFNGVTTQTKNTKTMSAVNSWAKALKMHKAKTGEFPAQQSCLGSPTTYPDTGDCWDGTYWDVKSNFLDSMSEYIGTYPEPDTTAISNTNIQRRGAFYYIPGGTTYVIRAMLVGQDSCPATSAGPLHASGADSLGIWCQYNLD